MVEKEGIIIKPIDRNCNFWHYPIPSIPLDMTDPEDQVKRQKLTCIQFEPDEVCQVLWNSESMRRGVHFAQKILMSAQFSNAIVKLMPNILLDDVYDYLENKTFKLKLIRLKRDMNAYACVYRIVDPEGIYLNPVLLLEMFTREIAKQSFFIGVKLIHEVSHLLNVCCDKTLRESKTLVTPEKQLNGHKFDDFGDMMEYSLFGGICEHTEKQCKHLFGIDDVVIYSYPGEPSGNIALLDNSFMDNIIQNCEADLTVNRGQSYSGKSTGARKAISFPSRASRVSESDVIGVDDCDNDDDDDLDTLNPLVRY